MAKNAKHHLPLTTPVAGPDTTDMLPRELTKHEFGRRLMALMLDKGWNQSELARAADLGRDAISTYIRGVSFPEPKNLVKLAKALGIEAEQLLPNVIANAMANDAAPMLEIRQAAGHPDSVWIRVNRLVTFDQAAQIFAILKEQPQA